MARRRVTVVASDGRQEGISWYEGATEMAVIRCARVALGLPTFGTAHLVWKSGDIVDFGMPIDDGATLHLDTVFQEDDAAIFAEAASARGGILGPNRRRFLTAPPPYLAAPCSYASPADYSPPGGGGGGGGESMATILSSAKHLLSFETNSSRQRVAAAWTGQDGTEKSCTSTDDDERLPLLRAKLVPAQSTDFYSRNDDNTHKLAPLSSPHPLRSDDRDDASSSPTEQRESIVKLKRILAHLANERTYLAWVRVSAKLFSAGVLSLTLAGKTSGDYSVCFVLLGLVYFALCPYLVFVGHRRYREAAEVMQGTAHDAYVYFARRELQAMTALMLILACFTVAILVVQLLAGY